MSEKDNPAERLYRHLRDAKQYTNGIVRDVLSNTLDVPTEPLDDFIEAVIQFYRLFDDVIGCLRRVGADDEELFIQPILRMRNAFPLTALDSAWDATRYRLSDVDMVSLRHAVYSLSKHPLPPAIKQDVLDQLQQDVTALYNLVDEASEMDVPEALREVMLRGLWEILTAIRQYNVRGAKPLHHALLVNAGTYVTYHPLFEQHKQSEEVSKYRKMIDKLRKTIPWAADISEITDALSAGVKAFLSDGS